MIWDYMGFVFSTCLHSLTIFNGHIISYGYNKMPKYL